MDSLIPVCKISGKTLLYLYLYQSTTHNYDTPMLVGAGAFSSVAWSIGVLWLQISSGVVWQTRDLLLSRNTLYLLSHRLCFFIVLICDLIVNRDDSWMRGLSCEPNNQLNVLYHFRKVRGWRRTVDLSPRTPSNIL